METIYEVSFLVNGVFTTRDFDNKDEARRTIEANGVGSLVTFIRGCDGRDRSCALETYVRGEWKGIDISR